MKRAKRVKRSVCLVQATLADPGGRGHRSRTQVHTGSRKFTQVHAGSRRFADVHVSWTGSRGASKAGAVKLLFLFKKYLKKKNGPVKFREIP